MTLFEPLFETMEQYGHTYQPYIEATLVSNVFQEMIYNYVVNG